MLERGGMRTATGPARRTFRVLPSCSLSRALFRFSECAPAGCCAADVRATIQRRLPRTGRAGWRVKLEAIMVVSRKHGHLTSNGALASHPHVKVHLPWTGCRKNGAKFVRWTSGRPGVQFNLSNTNETSNWTGDSSVCSERWRRYVGRKAGRARGGGAAPGPPLAGHTLGGRAACGFAARHSYARLRRILRLR